MAGFFRTYRIEADERIDGIFFLAFIHNGPYQLSPISVYKDGMINCWGLVDFEGFKEKVRSGWLVTQPPEGAQLSIAFLADFHAVNAHYWIDPEELIKEVADEIEELNGRPSTSDKCHAVWKEFQSNPTEEAKAKLKAAYEAIPKHNRRYVLGDMDTKDWPIYYTLYPSDEDA